MTTSAPDRARGAGLGHGLRAGLAAGFIVGLTGGLFAAFILARAPGVLRPAGAHELWLPALYLVLTVLAGGGGGLLLGLLLAFARAPWPTAIPVAGVGAVAVPFGIVINSWYLPALGSATSLLANGLFLVVALSCGLAVAGVSRRLMTVRPAPSASRLALVGLLLAMSCAALLLGTPDSMVVPPPWSGQVDAPLLDTVLLVTIDTLRADHMGVLGYPKETTPNIDALAADGAVYEEVVAEAPSTHPSLASMLTGAPLQAFDHTAIRDFVPAGIQTLAGEMRRHGYHTGAVVSNPFLKREMGFAQGFDRFDDHQAMVGDARRVTDVAVELALSLPAPRFLWIHYLDPHHPYTPPEPYSTRFGARLDRVDTLQRRPDLTELLRSAGRGSFPLSEAEWRRIGELYDGEIAFTDAEIGRLVHTLGDHGLLGSARIVLTADHGEEFRDHGGVLHAHTLHRELVRLPLIVWSTEPSARRGRVKDRVSASAIGGLVLGWGCGGSDAILSEKIESTRELGRALVSLRSPTHTLIASAYRPGPVAFQGRRWLRAVRDFVVFAPVAFKLELYRSEDRAETERVEEHEPEERLTMTRELRDRFHSTGAFRGTGALPGEETLQQLRGLGYLPGGSSPQ